MKSTELGGKQGKMDNLNKILWETYQATPGLVIERAKELKPEKKGRKPLEIGQSCKRTISTKGRLAWEGNKERKPSQLLRLLGWTRVSDSTAPSPRQGG